MRQYELAELPASELSRERGLTEVLGDSDLSHRKLVEKYAMFFRQEGDYLTTQFDAFEEPNDPFYIPYRAYLFHDIDVDGVEGTVPIIGAGCFRWRDQSSHEPCWTFDWLWFHPECRGQRLLAKYWPCFKDDFDYYRLQEPLSKSMLHFLQRAGEERPFVISHHQKPL